MFLYKLFLFYKRKKTIRHKFKNRTMILLWYSISSIFALVNSQSVLTINNTTNITYSYNSTNCILKSNLTGANIKCLILCQTISCQSLEFDAKTNSCSLYYGNPSLIQYDSLSDLNITYILSILAILCVY